MKKRNKIIYLTATALFSVLILFGAGMYFFNHQMVVEMITSLSYPAYIVYPLGIAKILGVIAIWSNKSKILKEWAYAGFVYELLLAVSAHINVQDGGYGGALVALILVLVSYTFYRKGLADNE